MMYDIWNIRRNTDENLLPTEFVYQATVSPGKPKPAQDQRVSLRIGHFLMAEEARRNGYPKNASVENFND